MEEWTIQPQGLKLEQKVTINGMENEYGLRPTLIPLKENSQFLKLSDSPNIGKIINQSSLRNYPNLTN